MSDNRVRIWFSLFVLAVFCVGVAGGVLADRAIMRRIYAARTFDGAPPRGPMGFGPPPMGSGRRPGGPPAMLVERLTRDLDLTADQQSKIEAVLTASRTRVETLQRDVHDRFVSEQQSLRDEIRKVLTPAQQEKFDQRERERGRFGRRGPPPPPPQ
jgi:Spy/CpxP family protein refolding chaperone